MRLHYVIGQLLLTAVVSGCGKDPRIDAMNRQVSASEAKIAELQKSVSELKHDLEEEKSTNATQGRLIFDLITREDHSVATLIPGEDQYSRLACGIGIITVKILKVDQIASGSKITVEFINPLSVNMAGLLFTAKYGRNEEGTKYPDQKSQLSKEISLASELRASSATIASFLLDGVPPDKLDYINLSGATEKGVRAFR